MNIAIFSKSGRKGGGASRCAEDLSYYLNKFNNKVDHFARSNETKNIIPLYSSFEKKVYHRFMDIGFQEIIPFERKVIKTYDGQNKYDIFHFHDISSTITPFTLKWLSDNKKNVVLTLHDFNTFSGGCVNPLDCTKYLKYCFNCPQLGKFPLARNLDLTFLFQYIRKYVHKNSLIHYIAPSKWIADIAYNTGLLKSYPTIISNAVDVDLFKEYNKIEVRNELQLPLDRFIILLSSSSLNDSFKGVEYAIKCINLLKELNPFILLVGNINDSILERLKDFDSFSTGYIYDKKILNKYYSCPDIFLNTTIADNQPITVLEVMASGTPNFGFATGGIVEIVDNEIDGYLIDNRDFKKLADKIIEQYNKKDVFSRLGKLSRKKIENKYSMNFFIKNHQILYEKIIKTNI